MRTHLSVDHRVDSEMPSAIRLHLHKHLKNRIVGLLVYFFIAQFLYELEKYPYEIGQFDKLVSIPC